MENWKWGRIFLSLLASVVALNLVSSYLTNRVYADTTGWVDAAIDAKDTRVIIEKLENAKKGMERWGATSGNAYLLFGGPESDLGEVNKNLETYLARAKELDGLEKTSKEYQEGLADLNESFYSLYLYADDYWLRHNGLILLILTRLAELGAIISCIAMFGYHISGNQKLLKQAVNTEQKKSS